VKESVKKDDKVSEIKGIQAGDGEETSQNLSRQSLMTVQ